VCLPPPFAIICILHIRSNCFEMLCGREIHFWASWKEARKHQEKKERPIMHDYLKYYIFSYEGELIAKRWWRHAKLSSSSEWKSAYLPQIILPLLSVLWLIPSASTRLQVRIGVPSFVLSSNSQTRSIPISLYIYIYIHQGSSFIPSTHPTLEGMLLVQLLVVSNRLKDPKQKL
jgi:hypothetical protein